MKKRILKILKKQQLIIGVSIVFSVILIAVLTPALFLRFTSWRAIADVNTQDLKLMQNVTENLVLLQSVDRTAVETYKNLIEKLVPRESDQLRVVTLVDTLAKSSGLVITSVKIGGSATTSTPATQTTGAQSSSSTTSQTGVGTTPVQPTSAGSAQAATPTPTKPSSINLNISFKGTFAEILKLLGLLENTKRTIGVKNITLTVDANTNLLIINADFTLPLSQKAQLTPQDKVELTQKDSDNLMNLLNKLTIDAVPSTLPTGRSDPFR